MVCRQKRSDVHAIYTLIAANQAELLIASMCDCLQISKSVTRSGMAARQANALRPMSHCLCRLKRRTLKAMPPMACRASAANLPTRVLWPAASALQRSCGVRRSAVSAAGVATWSPPPVTSVKGHHRIWSNASSWSRMSTAARWWAGHLEPI